MLDKTSDIDHIAVGEPRDFFSATHQEIRDGATTDIYFLRARDILRKLGRLDAVVTADVFCRRSGMMCGTEEVRRLMDGRGVEMLALTEGKRFEPGEVVIRFKGPYGAFGIFETSVLGILASSSAWATAASECRAAAGDSRLICFGARHIHPSVAPVMERAAIIGGADGCSCVLAALLSGIRPSGTIPHSAILIAGDTLTVAETFDSLMEESTLRIILVDTFKDEAEETLRLARALGRRLNGVRLDTPSERGGVGPDMVREIRARLDMEGFEHVKITVSGGLTPERITILKAAGADAFGVGSHISSARPIEMTMDIKEIDGKPIAKRGRIPGPGPAAASGLEKLL